MAIKRVHVRVAGRVQGVFFRACTQEEAQRIGLAGWVRNRPDGSVEAEIEGDGQDVDRLLAWLRQGSPLSQVDDVLVSSIEPIKTEKKFTIKY